MGRLVAFAMCLFGCGVVDDRDQAHRSMAARALKESVVHSSAQPVTRRWGRVLKHQVAMLLPLTVLGCVLTPTLVVRQSS